MPVDFPPPWSQLGWPVWEKSSAASLQREGVEAVLVLSADGLPIEHASREPFEAEPLAALTATLAQYATGWDSAPDAAHSAPR